MPVLRSINEDTAAIGVRPETIRQHTSHTCKRPFLDLQFGCMGTHFAPVYESRKCRSAAYVREELELSITRNFHIFLADLKLATLRAIITTSAKPKVCAAQIDVLSYAAITFAVQGTAESQICATREDQESTRGAPGLFNNGLASDGSYSVVWGEQPT